MITAPTMDAEVPMTEIPPFVPGLTGWKLVIILTLLSLIPISEANVSELMTPIEIANISKNGNLARWKLVARMLATAITHPSIPPYTTFEYPLSPVFPS